jgi:thiamine kinase-like enzyme
VFGGGGTKLYFLELRATATLALFVRFFVGLVKILSVIGNLANWWVRRRRNFHQVQTALARQLQRLERLHDSKLAALFINHPDLASANPLVDADAITLPEAAFCDIPP